MSKRRFLRIAERTTRPRRPAQLLIAAQVPDAGWLPCMANSREHLHLQLRLPRSGFAMPSRTMSAGQTRLERRIGYEIVGVSPSLMEPQSPLVRSLRPGQDDPQLLISDMSSDVWISRAHPLPSARFPHSACSVICFSVYTSSCAERVLSAFGRFALRALYTHT